MGIGALVLIRAINAVVCYRAMTQVIRASDWVEHTRVVRLHRQVIHALVTDAETSQRGYLLTGSADYLNPYKFARENIAKHLDGTQQPISDNPSQAARLFQLRALVESKFSELERTISLSDEAKKAEALALVQSDLGKRQMDSIRRLLDQIE